jgi:predicted dehydrogenase
VTIESQAYLPDWRPGRPYQEVYSAQADEGGVLRDLVHEIDYAGWIFGWPESLQATVKNLGRLNINSDESADLRWETPDHCAVTLRLDYLSRPARRRITAFGDQGTIDWDGNTQTVSLNLEDHPEQILGSDQARKAMFLCQTLAFIRSVQGTVNPMLATAADGIKALAVCDAARTSSESRREESVIYP